MKQIYLAGGFKSGWQTVVSDQFTSTKFIDPRSSGLTNEVEYTDWDLEAIENCDVILANLEEDNPGGYNMALEIGYAKAFGKYIIFIDGKDSANRYVGMLRACADEVFNTLQEGVNYLKKLGFV